jgi:hypothetical protein
VGNWYRVTKKINGRLYDYWQRTHRVGKSVKTENKYIGPASAWSCAPWHAASRSSTSCRTSKKERALLAGVTSQVSFDLDHDLAQVVVSRSCRGTILLRCRTLLVQICGSWKPVRRMIMPEQIRFP